MQPLPHAHSKSSQAKKQTTAISASSNHTRICTAPFEEVEMIQIKLTQICSVTPEQNQPYWPIQAQAHTNLYPLAGDDRRLTYSNQAAQIRVGWSSVTISLARPKPQAVMHRCLDLPPLQVHYKNSLRSFSLSMWPALPAL